MKFPKKEKIIRNVEISAAAYNIDVAFYAIYKPEKYFSDKAQMEIKLKRTKEARRMYRDVKAYYKTIKRLVRHGWIKTEKKAEDAAEINTEREAKNAPEFAQG